MIQLLISLECRQIPTLSAVLLTHATISHIGAFAHCCKHFPLFTRIPIFATTPVASLGRTLLQDLYNSTPLASTILSSSSSSETSYAYTNTSGESSNILLQPPTDEEIAGYFSLIHPLKYSQPHQPLSVPSASPDGLTITAYNAGHTLGGTIWHIQHGLESIVYAVDWNQARDHVLASAAWLGGTGAGGTDVIEQLRKPTALICSSRGAEQIALPGGRIKRDEILLDTIRSTVANGGIVLIPTDSSARVLELAYVLERAWREAAADPTSSNPLKGAKLYLASKNIGATMRYARSMIEWMDEGMEEEIQGDPSQNRSRDKAQKDSQTSGKAGAPFDFKYLRLIERKKQVERLLDRAALSRGSGPGRVILASDSTIEWGFSREILRRIAVDDHNTIVLTESLTISSDSEEHHRSTIGQDLWGLWANKSANVQNAIMSASANRVPGGGALLQVRDVSPAPLAENELYKYQQYLATQRKLQDTLRAGDGAAITTADVADDISSASSSSSEDSDSEHQGKALNVSMSLAHSNRHKLGLSNKDLGVMVLIKGEGVYDFDVRGKRGRERVFPYVAKRKRVDDYGEMIRPEEYLRAEEREDLDGPAEARALGNTESSGSLGQKRRWNEMLPQGGRRLSNGTAKRRRTNGKVGVNGDAKTRANGHDRQQDESDDESSEGSDAEAEDPVTTGPSKAVFSTSTIDLKLGIAFVDFAGLHDKRSLQTLIPLIHPRKVILVGGMKQETMSLAADCRKVFAGSGESSKSGSAVDVFTPTIGRSVDASVDTNAWAINLSESLLKRLQWQKVKGLGVVHLIGRLALSRIENFPNDNFEMNKKQKLLEDVKTDSKKQSTTTKQDVFLAGPPVLDVIPANNAASTRSMSRPLHVGDLRLADLRRTLQNSGHVAEFRGEGTLLVDGVVAVRKSGTGRVEIEGGGLKAAEGGSSRNREGTFFAVRNKIYEGLAVVNG